MISSQAIIMFFRKINMTILKNSYCSHLKKNSTLKNLLQLTLLSQIEHSPVEGPENWVSPIFAFLTMDTISVCI